MNAPLASDSAIWLELTGADQGWLKRCRAVSSQKPTALAEVSDDSPAAQALQQAAIRVASDPGRGLDAPVVSYDWHVATRIRGLALALAGIIDPTEAVAELVRHAEGARLYSATRPEQRLRDSAHDHRQQAPADAPSQVQHALGRLRSHENEASLVELLALHLADRFPSSRDSVTVPVVFATAVHRPVPAVASGRGAVEPGRSGLVGKLTVELLADGPAGMHPDPRMMCFLRADDEFVQSLQRAWASAPSRLAGGCVVWRLQLSTQASRPVDDINGGSLGAAYAVALRDLGRHGRMRRATRLSTLDPRCAVTAALAEDGHRLTTVTGLDSKIAAAKTAGFRLIVAHADLVTAQCTPNSNHVPIAGVPTVDKAETACRTHVNRRARVALVALVVLMISTLVPTLTALEQRSNARAQRALADSRREAVDRERRAADLERSRALGLALADASRGASTTNPALALALAAESSAATDPPLIEATEALIGARMAFARSTVVPLGAPLARGKGPVRSATLSPDGTLLAAADDCGIQFWKTADGEADSLAIPSKSRRCLPAQPDLGHIQFSPDGKLLVAASFSGVTLWRLPQGTKEAILPGASSPAFTPDGATLVTADYDGGVKLWPITSHGRVESVPRTLDQSRFATSVAVSANGNLIAAGIDDGSIRVWEARTGATHWSTVSQGYDAVYSLAFQPGGSLIVTTKYEGGVQLWDTSAEDTRAIWTHNSSDLWAPPSEIAFAPDGSKLAISMGDDDYSIGILDVATGRQIGDPVRRHAGPVSDLAFNPDGTLLVSSSHDGTLQRWRIRGPAPTGIVSNAEFLGLSPDGTLLAVHGDRRGILLRQTTDGRVRWFRGHRPGKPAVAFDPTGQMIAITGTDEAEVEVRSAVTGEILSPVIQRPTVGRAVMAFDHKGTLLAIFTARDRATRIWDLATGRQLGRPISCSGHEMPQLAFSPTGNRIAITCENMILTAGIPSMRAGEHLFSAPGISLDALAFSPDGSLLAVAADNTVWIHDTSSPARTVAVARGHTAPISSLDFSDDARLLASAGYDGTARLWVVPSGEPLGPPMPLISTVTHGVTSADLRPPSIAFSPSGSLIVWRGSARSGTITHLDRLYSIERACALARPFVLTTEIKNRLPDGAKPHCLDKQGRG